MLSVGLLCQQNPFLRDSELHGLSTEAMAGLLKGLLLTRYIYFKLGGWYSHTFLNFKPLRVCRQVTYPPRGNRCCRSFNCLPEKIYMYHPHMDTHTGRHIVYVYRCTPSVHSLIYRESTHIKTHIHHTSY